jgi:hypothetical protein
VWEGFPPVTMLASKNGGLTWWKPWKNRSWTMKNCGCQEWYVIEQKLRFRSRKWWFYMHV